MLFVMLFIIAVLIAVICVLFTLLIGALANLTFTEEEIEKARNVDRDRLTFFEYWATRYLLFCNDNMRIAVERYGFNSRKEA